ncbi:hypothetical protein PAXRUDRAFT_829079 [Paxillus rubicundulus Ve08.2h10]|uniref:Uncharacterized protein n=1 Tax=Paxillus rubicundulus Ve08.2h10 TaxID=930991 RepID=A0A0D0DNC5_9AGAM|nr:hypothetical protein PAXRUDRAFT_829079 [Paxillus rubicundulus Ve08.2h10]
MVSVKCQIRVWQPEVNLMSHQFKVKGQDDWACKFRVIGGIKLYFPLGLALNPAFPPLTRIFLLGQYRNLSPAMGVYTRAQVPSRDHFNAKSSNVGPAGGKFPFALWGVIRSTCSIRATAPLLATSATPQNVKCCSEGTTSCHQGSYPKWRVKWACEVECCASLVKLPCNIGPAIEIDQVVVLAIR